MGISFEIDTKELQKVAEKRNGIKLRAEDIKLASPAIRLLMQEDADLRFQSAPAVETGGEVYGGVQWRELSESYLASSPRRVGGQILRDTGELRQSLTVEGSFYAIFEATDSEIVFGTALAKAGKLQRDRPFLFWHPILLEKVSDYLARWLGE